MDQDFREIAHSGGTITFTIRTDADGRKGYQVGVRSSRPVPMVMIGVYALPQGEPVASLNVGMPTWEPPPIAGCFPVLIQSDSQGIFGHHCSRCQGYWRSGPWPNFCPYCNFQAEGYQFLSDAQRRYVAHYCNVLGTALEELENGEVTIDMNEVADAVDKDPSDRPAFYVAEESQQHKFRCKACDEYNDILGRFGYCAVCGTRNDLSKFEDITVPAIRDRLNNGAPPQDCVRDAVAAFDTFCAQYGKQLAALTAMTRRRARRLQDHSYHELTEVRGLFREWFDIDICHGMRDGEIATAGRMFFRRHLYEHNGGVVDQKYLDNSQDPTVRLNQVIRETQDGAHTLLGSLLKMARNLHAGFHELIEVNDRAIKAFEEKKRRMADRS